jgi:hypothetical protein
MFTVSGTQLAVTLFTARGDFADAIFYEVSGLNLGRSTENPGWYFRVFYQASRYHGTLKYATIGSLHMLCNYYLQIILLIEDFFR